MNNKRDSLKKLTGISAVAAFVPNSWVKPVVSSVVLPVHAQTSNSLPQGADITIDVEGRSLAVIKLDSYISGLDSESHSINIVDYGVLRYILSENSSPGDIIFRVKIALDDVLNIELDTQGTTKDFEVDAFVDYSITDGINTSITHRVTILNLCNLC